MIKIDLKIKDREDVLCIKDEVLFNALLSQKPEFIKKLIKTMSPLYRIKSTFFEIVNPFVDIDAGGNSLYAGLIVRTDYASYAVLYLENTVVDEDYMVGLITNFIHDLGEMSEVEIDINTFEVDKKTFLKSL